MKRILILGAGQSSPVLIHHLLEHAEALDAEITVADLDLDAARNRVGGHPRGIAIALDVNDVGRRREMIAAADVVVSLLAPWFHHLVAEDCVAEGTSMVTASYRDAGIRALDDAAREKGVLVLSEMGMDPGIDHMSAMAMIDTLREGGATIRAFRSYGAGLPSVECAPDRPLRYAITWNPKNVAIAAQYGAQYFENGAIKIVPYHDVFDHTWSASVPGIGEFEAYANRDSLGYKELFGLDSVHTMIRGTLRYPGWCETWGAVVRLGITNDTLAIPDLTSRSWRALTEMFLPPAGPDDVLEARVARHLGINPTGRIMGNLAWLGIFDDTPVSARGNSPADALAGLLVDRLPLPPGGRDMAILQHEVDVEWPADRPNERIVSTLAIFGEPDGFTAMSQTVGLPAAIAVRMILSGQIDLTGCRIPIERAIYEPVLRELSNHGLMFNERSEEI